MEYRVDIDAANAAKAELSKYIDDRDPRLLNKVGAFASLFRLDLTGFREPVLVLKTEEPGSKQILAFRHDRIESVCTDMIHHLINDCVATGAIPLAVQDLIVCGRLDVTIVQRIVRAIGLACEAQGCVLTGGETTEQPGVVPQGTFILGSSIVGVVERSRIIDGSKIGPGDVVVALRSSGPHTNGYTMIRDILDATPTLAAAQVDGRSFLDAILEPHRCYHAAIKPLFDGRALGIAHITGGGIKENLNRILPSHVDASIDLGAYEVPEVFRVIQRAGKIAPDVMLRTFNMGVGLVLVCKEHDLQSVKETLAESGEQAFSIGAIVPGTGKVACHGTLRAP